MDANRGLMLDIHPCSAQATFPQGARLESAFWLVELGIVFAPKSLQSFLELLTRSDRNCLCKEKR